MISMKFLWIIFGFDWLIHCKLTMSVPVANDTKIPSPIILVPGDGGSRAYSDVNYRFFTVKTLVWVNFEYMLLPSELRDVFKLEYDPKTHTTSDAVGSNVSFPGWGATDTIEELDEWKHSQTTYFSPLVNSLIVDKFYIRNKTIRGAPYDFRKAPNENQKFVQDMKTLVEETFKLSGNQKVVILGHSQGALYSLYFFKRMSVAWKKQYIRSFISVSGPLGGAVKAVYLETTGASLGSPRSPLLFREMQRSFPSTSFLLPDPDIFGNDPIVITAKRNYSANDYKDLFKDMSMPYGHMMYEDTKDLVNGSEGPEGIDEIYCVYAYGSPTPIQLKFKEFPDELPQVINGDGDHTVNINSLKLCQIWPFVNIVTIKGQDHMAIVGSAEFLNTLKQILYRQPKRSLQSSLNGNKKKSKYMVPVF